MNDRTGRGQGMRGCEVEGSSSPARCWGQELTAQNKCSRGVQTTGVRQPRMAASATQHKIINY